MRTHASHRQPALRSYKAYFRWNHYNFKPGATQQLPTETDACASVTAAFLQVCACAWPHAGSATRAGGQP